ncbi:hypothetical protein A4D02_31940 [Niastella koreensis]|uniref:Uncharacterized protein n=2 Tax=Niastella koreensis TaxID=354356 RepID=G8TAN3_NIAKG|nr:hypothetical protein [Niastella koreensis]AEV99213.1 hypothetical protein Niako_2880 [Niastella koreensis GR20-10]OQP46169.1 hypothetical protein A4D02_31940 [Niastella koreensis]
MTTKKENQAPKKRAIKEEDNFNVEDKEALEAAKTDTPAPDEFIGPDADTDVPLDGGVENDAVLRGEHHADENEKKDKLPPDK